MDWSALPGTLALFSPFVTGAATLVAASMALTAWRRNILGARQVALAEKCLTTGWRLHDEIKKARMEMPYLSGEVGFEDPNTPESRKRLFERRGRAEAALRVCRPIYGEFEATYALTEMYLGPLARVTSAGETRFFRNHPYSIAQEYDEIITVLFGCLSHVVPSGDPQIELTDEQLKKQDRAAALFFGFLADHIEDEITARLRIAREALDRRMSSVLRRRGIMGRLLDRAVDALLRVNRRKITISAEWQPRPEAAKGRRARGGKR